MAPPTTAKSLTCPQMPLWPFLPSYANLWISSRGRKGTRKTKPNASVFALNKISVLSAIGVLFRGIKITGIRKTSLQAQRVGRKAAMADLRQAGQLRAFCSHGARTAGGSVHSLTDKTGAGGPGGTHRVSQRTTVAPQPGAVLLSVWSDCQVELQREVAVAAVPLTLPGEHSPLPSEP